ncbi:hypothetical protein PYCH_05950 [Pyrococcus yayanosii CH1]|uniref:Condensin complex subunit 1 C-terminal domain-containing protein n=1 Tax=Pyrococcus yayanosii (strain CH1 / JCM 16557) TaxID=529709 RepID=F8AI56_PYRYC|nr:hypothetical protein PYCH_05950 [Pyrococcus yayanosii CH1]
MKYAEILEEYIKGWRLRKAVELVESNREALLDLEKLLHHKDPLLKKGALYIIKKLASRGKLSLEDVKFFLPSLIDLLDDKEESVVLQTVETINAIITFVELDEKTSEELSSLLMKTVENKPVPINEYAAEGLAAIGAKILTVARKIFSWIRAIIRGSSEDKKVAVLRVLREMVARTKNPQIMEEAFNLALDLLNNEDPIVRRAALRIVEVAVDRNELLSRASLERASKELSSSSLGKKAMEAKERIDEYLRGETKPASVEELPEYSVGMIKKMFEREQHPAVLELARRDYGVLKLVIKIFLSEDLLTKLDALWVLSNAAGYIKRDDAEKLIPQLRELLLHDNPWIKSTSAKLFGELAVNYSSLMDEAIRTILEYLESKDPKKVGAALELAEAILSRVENLGLIEEIVRRLVEMDRLTPEALEFIKKHEREIEDLEPELKKRLTMKLASFIAPP